MVMTKIDKVVMSISICIVCTYLVESASVRSENHLLDIVVH